MDDKKFSKTKICLQCVFVFLQIMPCVFCVKNWLLDMNAYGFRLYKKVNPDNRTVVGIYFFCEQNYLCALQRYFNLVQFATELFVGFGKVGDSFASM